MPKSSQQVKYGKNPPVLKKSLIFSVFLSNSETICQVYSDLVPSSNLRSLLFRNLEDGKFDFMDPPQ